MQRIFLTVTIIVLTSITVYRIFSGQSVQQVQKWDEQTNIAVVKNSLAHKSFPILYLNDKPFFEKPPLWYIATAAVVTVTNTTPFSMRLVSSLSGAGLILLSVLLAWRWWGKLAGITAWIVLLGSNQLFITNAGGYFSTHTLRSADLDAMQIFFMVITFAACIDITSSNLIPVLTGVATGLALLTKGPLGLIPLIAATMLFAHSKRTAKYHFLLAWVTLFVTAAPWYLIMIIRFGFPFISTHFGYHIIDRALLPIEGHNLPPWYYFELLTNHAVFFPWEILAGSLIWILTKKLYHDPKILYVIVLTIILFITPTLIRTRLAWYILPFYPFAALAIGAAIADVGKQIGASHTCNHKSHVSR